MSDVIRQKITVENEGRIEIRSPELHTGVTAEVIVTISELPVSGDVWLKAFRELQRSMALTPEAAEAWAKQVRDERYSSTRAVS